MTTRISTGLNCLLAAAGLIAFGCSGPGGKPVVPEPRAPSVTEPSAQPADPVEQPAAPEAPAVAETPAQPPAPVKKPVAPEQEAPRVAPAPVRPPVAEPKAPERVATGPVIPLELPPPGDTPPAKNKPVKVYILSGQSNMVGFAALKNARPVYPSIYLSADPSVKPCKMPVGPSALLPHYVWQAATGDATGARASIYRGGYDPKADYSAMRPVKGTTVPLGTVSAELPAVDGPHTLVVRAFVEVPMSGPHELHAGYGESTHAVVTLDGKEVYRKDVGGDEVVKKVALEKGRRYPITITYMKGGSAAFWMERVDIEGKGDLEWVVKERGMFRCMMDEKGEWTVRNDVVLCESYLDKNKFKGGRRTPLSPTANGRTFGPELGFGYVIGAFHDEPVLLIKADIGNRSLGWDVLPPGSKPYEYEGKVYPGYRGTPDSPDGKNVPEGAWYAGLEYDNYTKAVHGVLDNFDTLYPEFKDQGYEVAGFVWWQGHKDQNENHASRYEQNLVRFIKAWRKEFKAPEAKWVIATIGFGGWKLGEPGLTVANAQLAVSGEKGKYPEFRGNVKTVETRGYWRGLGESPTGKGYHYNHNAETYILTGDALGRAMVELQGGRAEKRTGVARAPKKDKAWPENPTPQEGVEMVYSDAFLSAYSHDDAEPTPEEMAKMGPAMSPFIVGRMIPAYVKNATSDPRLFGRENSVVPLVTGKRPKKIGRDITNQLDGLISYYNAAGVHDYDWKRFGPDMQHATWSYISFDPPEKQPLNKSNRYRKVTFPGGTENWYAVDFDPEAAGWKTGQAPFGQKDGKKVALRAKCALPQCGCDTVPGTLWEKEVLAIRQTFDIPPLREGHVYRLILGGCCHGRTGEGFAIYVNGKLFAQSSGGFFLRRHGPGICGANIYSDFMPEFKSGKVTIAVIGFLRYTYHRNQTKYRGTPVPPNGHISVWLEEAKVPGIVLGAIDRGQ